MTQRSHPELKLIEVARRMRPARGESITTCPVWTYRRAKARESATRVVDDERPDRAKGGGTATTDAQSSSTCSTP
jgi:hypothetical protein